MTPEIQELLARNLQHLRDVRAARDPHANLAFAHVEGVLAALESTHVLNADEVRMWRGRVAEIVQNPSPRRRRKTPARPPRRRALLRRAIAGPPTPEPFLDGWMRVVVVELFDSLVRVHWNLGPLPSYEVVLGDDLARLDRDTEGLPEEEREHQRQSARWSRLLQLKQFSLSDDVGTRYRYSRGGSQGSWVYDEITGIANFAPAAPAEVTRLDIAILEAHFAVQIAD